MSNPSQVSILLVEDDPGHARLIEKNLRRARLHNDIIHLPDGQAALDFIYSAGAYAGQARPQHLLILLDINMPGVDGYQVLERLKSDETTRPIPVIMLTTTDDEHEIRRCYQLGCNVYVTKPVDYETFSSAIAELGLFMAIIAVP